MRCPFFTKLLLGITSVPDSVLFFWSVIQNHESRSVSRSSTSKLLTCGRSWFKNCFQNKFCNFVCKPLQRFHCLGVKSEEPDPETRKYRIRLDQDHLVQNVDEFSLLLCSNVCLQRAECCLPPRIPWRRPACQGWAWPPVWRCVGRGWSRSDCPPPRRPLYPPPLSTPFLSG